MLVDDLQWHAGETLEWLAFLIRFRPQARVLVIGALRSEEVDADHPAASWLLDLRSAGLLTELTLAPFSPAETDDLVRQVTRQSLDEATSHSLYRFTEGNPLFVIETLRAAPDIAAVGMADVARPAGAAAHPLSPRMAAVIQSRLARLSPPARDLAALAATIGRSFPSAVLAQACEQAEELFVQSLDELWQRRIVREQGTSGYDFTHDRLRDVAYAAISPAQRKLLHRRVAHALAQASADTDAVSAQIAGHLQAGGDLRGAIGYYQRAVDVALRLFAYREAITLLERALAIVQALPASTVSLESELELQMKLCTAWSAITSYLGKEAERAYTRALHLCRQLTHTSHLFTVLWGLHEVALYRTDYAASVELAEQCLAIAAELGDAGLQLEAHHAAWGPYYFLGEFDKAMAHMRAGLALYDRQAHEALSAEYGVHDACACALYESALACWSLGRLDEAQAWLARAVAHVRVLTMPANIADAEAYAGLLYHLLRDPAHTQAAAERALAISMEKGYPYTRFLGAVALGWSLAMQGQHGGGRCPGAAGDGGQYRIRPAPASQPACRHAGGGVPPGRPSRRSAGCGRCGHRPLCPLPRSDRRARSLAAQGRGAGPAGRACCGDRGVFRCRSRPGPCVGRPRIGIARRDPAGAPPAATRPRSRRAPDAATGLRLVQRGPRHPRSARRSNAAGRTGCRRVNPPYPPNPWFIPDAR